MKSPWLAEAYWSQRSSRRARDWKGMEAAVVSESNEARAVIDFMVSIADSVNYSQLVNSGMLRLLCSC